MKRIHNYPTYHYEDLKEMLNKSVEIYQDRTAFMQKEDGVYHNISYKQYLSDVNALGTYLISNGLKGKRIIVVGDNCYAWVVSYMAIINGTGCVVPVDKELNSEELLNIATISEAEAVLYSDRLEEKINVLPKSIKQFAFSTLPSLIESGKQRIENDDFTFLNATINPNEMASLIFTSGTTGVSKGVMLSHHNICFDLEEMCSMIKMLGKNHRVLSILPLHHAYECTCGFLCQIYAGSTIAFSEGLRYVTKNMQEVQPTLILSVPLLLETFYNKIWHNISKQGLEAKVTSAIKATNKLVPESLRMKTKKRIFENIHKSFGGKLEMFVCGGAAINPKVIKGLRDLGIYAYQGYGLTECAPIAALNRDTFYKDNSAGTNTPNAKLDIYDPQNDGTGEIRYQGENVMLGYYKQPDLTSEVIHDGWFYTGDLGYIDEDGYLIITGRKKNVIVTYNGKNIFPEELESYLSRSCFVLESVVVGYKNAKKNDYDIVALICPNKDAFINAFGKEYTEDQVNQELQKAIDEVNNQVQSYKRITFFLLHPEAFPKNTSQKIKRAGLLEESYPLYIEKTNQS